jgi:hypothetical protein
MEASPSIQPSRLDAWYVLIEIVVGSADKELFTIDQGAG